MKKSLLSILMAGFILASCMAPVEKQYFTESADIDLGKKVIEAYLAGNWDAMSEYYSDTAKIWVNTWEDSDAINLEQYIENHKANLEPISSYTFDPQVWESVITDDGEHWVHFWSPWKGHNTATDKDYEIVVHVAFQIVDNKVAWQGDIFNNTEIAMDMMALQMEADEGEDHHDDEDDDAM